MRASGWALSALVYTLLTAILGRDVLAQIGTSIANDPGDPLLTAAILYWNAHHIPWTEAWWQFPIYHPTRDTLTFSEHLLGLSVIASPIAWISGNPLTTYNLTALLTFPLCGLSMYALVAYLTRNQAAAFLAGLAYAFAPYRMSNLPHVQMLASFWAPLALLGLHGFLNADAARHTGTTASSSTREGVSSRLRQTPAWWLTLFAACWALQAAANWYLLVLFSILVALWVVWFVVIPRRWRALVSIAAAAAIASLPLAPLVYRYVTVHAYHNFGRSVGEVRGYSADVAALLCAPSHLTVWGWIRVACRAEGELFPGVAAFALLAVALVVTLRRRHGHDAPFVSARAARAFRLIRRLLMMGAALYGLVVVSVLVAGPWQFGIGPVRVSASSIDKPVLIALAAAVAALVASLGAEAARRPPSPIGFYLFAAVSMWLLALGPTVTLMGAQTGRPGPFVLLQALPGVSGLRVPARFWLLAVMCLTTVVGLISTRLLARAGPRLRAAAVGIVACALLADGWMAAIPAPPPPAPVPDALALRNTVVLQLPIDPYPDITATWRAATGGWRTVNGYSGYAPNYYTALTLAARKGDDSLLAPFLREHDLHVVVADESTALKAVVERQPGATMTAQGYGSTQYHLRRQASPAAAPVGQPLRVVAATSSCASADVALILDGDEGSHWECLESTKQHWLTVDLGTPVSIAAVVYNVGPYSWNVPSDLTIEASIDGTAWEPVRHGSILRELIEGGLADPGALRATLRFPPRRARYLRMRPADQPEEFAWFVAEIRVLSS